tara:strand:- start:1884 stop:2111 length:228 start_codon:yes stop_codon:yes gene_type:complete
MGQHLKERFGKALMTDFSQPDEPAMVNLIAFEEGAKITLEAIMGLMMDEMFTELEEALGDEKMVFDKMEDIEKWM